MHLLTDDNAKTIKGEELRIKTWILYLVPADGAGRGNICAGSTEGCRKACLYGAGLASVYPTIKAARMRKTHLLFDNRELFLTQLRKDIKSAIRIAAKDGFTPCIRINGTSDLPWLALQMASEFPDVQFYDYTKLNRPWERVRDNYSLTYSYSGENLDMALESLKNDINVSVVFDTKKGKALPETWNGYPVIDGDLHDLRFIDPKGVVVGLRAKGDAKHDELGFVVKTAAAQLVQIGKVA
jgi:hypothetical protein